MFYMYFEEFGNHEVCERIAIEILVTEMTIRESIKFIVIFVLSVFVMYTLWISLAFFFWNMYRSDKLRHLCIFRFEYIYVHLPDLDADSPSTNEPWSHL